MSTESAAAALFASYLQPSQHASCDQARDAIRGSLRRNGGVRGCAAVCALEYGEHPDSARARMRWALEFVAQMRRSAPMAA